MAITGLTYRLKDRKFNVKDWMVEDVVRQFGIAAVLRDTYKNLNKRKIYKALKKDDARRNKEIERALHPTYPEKLSERQLKKKYKKALKEWNCEWKKAQQQKEKILACIKEFESIYNKNMKSKYRRPTTLVANLLDYAKEQLKILQEDNNSTIDWLREVGNKRYMMLEFYKRYIEQERKKEIEYLDWKKANAKTKEYYNNAEEYKQLIDAIYK